MRFKKTILNVSSNLIIMLMRTIMLFVVRIIFIRVLGEIYLGIDSLFTNLLSVLSIVDLGISSAINYTLYKPLAEKDYNRVSSLMTFYKKLYIYMGIAICIIGLLISLFLNVIVTYDIKNIYLIYFLYLFNTASTYFISYKESLIIADQNRYKLTHINFFFYMLLYILRIISLLLVKNFIVYVLILVIVTLIQRMFINIYISKNYDYIDFNSKDNLKKSEKKDIFSNVKAIFMHKIGSFVINGTDSVIISASKNLGIIYVGLYTNYLSIISMTTSIYEAVYKGITSSFGNLAVLENEDSQERVFDIVNFVGFLMYGLTFIGFIFLLTPLVKMCFGIQYELEANVVFVMALNFYIAGLIASIDMIKEATGTYKVDKYIPIIQSIINLVVSVILVHFTGLIGVVLGTLISYVVLSLWNKPYIAYKYIFRSSIFHYLKNQMKYIVVLLSSMISIYFIFKSLSIGNILLDFILKIMICIICFSIFVVFVFKNSEELYFIKRKIFKVMKQKKEEKKHG